MNNHSFFISVLMAGALLCCSGAIAAEPAVGSEQRAAEQAAAVRDYLGRDMIFITSPDLANYLQDIAMKLLATRNAPPPMPQFLIQSTAEFSVFTDIRGNIVVGSEVLRRVESEDELAAALSHELAHVIANDANTKNLIQQLPSTVEATQMISGSVDGRNQKVTARPGELSNFATDGLATTQATGTVWTDLIAPGWNRKQERDADLAGVDMARAAGYDPAAFSTLFARLDAAQATRSARVESLRQDALKRVKTNTSPAKTNGDDLLGGVKSSVETGAVEAAFEGLAGWGTDYDTPEQRTQAVLEHVKNTSTGRRDKTPRSPRFDAELRHGPNQQLLAADHAALEVMAAVNSSKPQVARPFAESLTNGSAKEPLSPHLNLAIGTWLDTVERRPADAEQRASAWTQTDLAPRAAFLWRASYQIQQHDFANALTTLELGSASLQNRSLFLPQMIAVARSGGNLPKADELAMECSRSGAGRSVTSATDLLNRANNMTGGKPTGLYAECVAALGYDPVQRREQALTIQPAAGQKTLPDIREGLAEKLRKALGK